MDEKLKIISLPVNALPTAEQRKRIERKGHDREIAEVVAIFNFEENLANQARDGTREEFGDLLAYAVVGAIVFFMIGTLLVGNFIQ